MNKLNIIKINIIKNYKYLYYNNKDNTKYKRI